MDIVLDALDSLHEDMRWNNKNGIMLLLILTT